VQLTDKDKQVREKIEEIFRKTGYQPPALSDLQNTVTANPEEVRRIYFWMIKEKILIKIAEDLVYHKTTMDSIKQQIKSKFTPGTKFGVADFKEIFDITRKHAIPLLEYLDREKFTRRLGNERILL
jgi:selenocysteine-specific elongation factor